MTRFIKLTNTVGAHSGNPIYMNVDQITSIYEMPREDGGSLVTVVYGGPKGEAWNVAESPKEIIKLVEEK